ncbi:hypothetical protein [uncultured Ruminococcus sp.]|uniref:hypothetical protein n=1 Tax=uncultured Ruminococcus sp. TaxID=165186 RepID=UPI002608FFC4|nr:hypothetical protein [uncultured Ruminococcus sp.]
MCSNDFLDKLKSGDSLKDFNPDDTNDFLQTVNEGYSPDDESLSYYTNNTPKNDK